jgi:phosphate transport system permease protein
MTTSVLERPMPAVDLLSARPSGRRRVTDRLATGALTLSFLVAMVPLALVIWLVVSKGIGILSWDFLTADIPRQFRAIGPGMGPAVAGTLVITAAASAMAIPLGILGAIYLNEFGGRGILARLIRFMSDVMTGVPSIVMGLFIYVVWVRRFESQSGLAGALALACLMLPIVIRTTDEMLKLVPDELRQGSVALGARSLRTTMSVVIPTALPGIVSGAMLAVARAAGETAPLLFTISVVNTASWSLFGPNTTLSAQIFRNASQPFPGAQDRAWGAALTLVLLVFVLTLVARFVAARFTLKHQ